MVEPLGTIFECRQRMMQPDFFYIDLCSNFNVDDFVLKGLRRRTVDKRQIGDRLSEKLTSFFE